MTIYFKAVDWSC